MKRNKTMHLNVRKIEDLQYTTGTKKEHSEAEQNRAPQTTIFGK